MKHKFLTKAVAVLLIIGMTASFAACSKDDSGDGADTTATHETESPETPRILTSEEFIDPMSISFKSQTALEANTALRSGNLEYTDNGARLVGMIAPQLVSKGYLLEEHLYISLKYRTESAGTITFSNGATDTVIASDTSISNGEWVYTEPFYLTARSREQFVSGNANTITFSGDGELYIAELAFLSDPTQAEKHFREKESNTPEPTTKPLVWKFGNDVLMADSGCTIDVQYNGDNSIDHNISGHYENAIIDGEPCVKLNYYKGKFGEYVFTPKGSSEVEGTYKYARVTYYVEGVSSNSTKIRFVNHANAYLSFQFTDDLSINQGRWTVSQTVSLSDIVANRINDGNFLIFSAKSEESDLQLYVKEIAFFETKEQAYEYYGDQPGSDYLDAHLGEFTTVTIFDGEGMGEWENQKQDGILLKYTDDASYGGSYRIMYKFVFIETIGTNKYMRVVYKADNGSAADNVSLVTVSPDTGETAVLSSDVRDTNGEWVLSGVAELTKDLYDRLAGAGEYTTNDYEKMYHKHNSLAFTNTAKDASYSIKNIYFFKTLEDALNFKLPSYVYDNESDYVIGNTRYSEAVLDSQVDADLAENSYRIYVEADRLQVRAGSEATLEFANEVARMRVLEGDMYDEMVSLKLDSDFVLEGIMADEAKIAEIISLKYDDYYTFEGKQVALVKSDSITSTDVITGEPDVTVMRRMYGETFAARAIGTATVYFTDGTCVKVDVTRATISVLMLAGQSNAEGVAGDPSTAIRNKPGQVYSTYAIAGYRYIDMVLGTGYPYDMDALTLYSTKVFVPKSLTTNENLVNSEIIFGLGELNEGGYNKGGYNKGGMDSAIAYQWNKRTGDKVWLVNVAHSGSGIQSWVPGDSVTDNNFWQAVGVMKRIEDTLRKEIAAGHYELNHMGYFWHQGCTNRLRDPDSEYTVMYRQMHDGFVEQLSFDHDGDPTTPEKTIEFGGILLVRTAEENNAESDYYMYGPRLSQYFLGNSAAGSDRDIYLASNVGDIFKTNDDVRDYFINKYGTDENFMKECNVTYRMPISMNQVHPDIHYRQAGYHEIAMDAVDNILYQMGYVEAPECEVTITILDKHGLELDISNGLLLAKGESVTLVPVASPRYKAGDVSFTVAQDNLTVDDHYVFTSKDGGANTITFTCADTSVIVKIN